jgi:hypothetical protein
MLSYKDAALYMTYRTPFQRIPINRDLYERGWLSAKLQQELNGRFGFDIWPVGKGKVLNVLWNRDGGPKTVVRFQRGDWEEELLTKARINSTR